MILYLFLSKLNSYSYYKNLFVIENIYYKINIKNINLGIIN